MAKEQIVTQPPSGPTQQRFSQLPSAEVDRSTFDRSHAWKGTFDSGRLIPFLCDEILPGDTFNVNSTAFMRLSTPLKPFMDNVHCDVHYFFVPNRLVWDNWQRFMGERANPSDDITTLQVPQGTLSPTRANVEGYVTDYLGLPYLESGTPGNIVFNELPLRGLRLIYNEWYRDQNLQNPTDVPTGDGGSLWNQETLLPRGKRKDYYTSALPWPQKGDPVFLPLGTAAPVKGVGFDSSMNASAGWPGVREADGTERTYTTAAQPPNNIHWEVTGTAPNQRPTIYADLTSATSATINDIRTAFQIQRLLERDARGGTRYIEIILNHFNVQSPDFRLQRPEYLGGGYGVLNVNPVAATTGYNQANQDVPQGNLSATATGVVKAGFQQSFTEHGYIFGIISVRADLTYQNGLERMWSRKTRYDFYWPALSHLGEQGILNKEVLFQGAAADEQIWGYQERYAEYRYKPGRITGKFRSAAANSLDVWHLAQDFKLDLPPLNASFIQESPPIDRVVAVPSEPQFIADVWHNMQCTRPMPVYSVPGFVDHF